MQVLACKIWYELAKGAKADFQPQSWKTVWYFVNGLQALRHYKDDPTNTAKHAFAEWCFRNIVEDVDPLYRPAHFFWGLVCLDRGDVKVAQAEFEDLTALVDERGDRMLGRIKDEWGVGSSGRRI